jgi:hypothetical protein
VGLLTRKKVVIPMPSIDEILASSPLAGLRRVSASGGDRQVALVRLAESFNDLDQAPAESLVIMSRFASAEISDYRLDMALRWGALHRVAAVAAFSAELWQPTVTAKDIGARADIALISIPAELELAALVQAVMREIGGGAERALGRAQQGLEAVLAAESAGGGLEDLRVAVSAALGTPIEFRPWTGDGFAAAADEAARRSAANGGSGSGFGGPGARSGSHPAAEVIAPVVVGETPAGYFVAPDAHGDFGVGVRLVLHTAALAAGRLLDLARRAHETPVRSRSELLAELLMTDAAINEDLLERARALAIPVTGWHVVVRIEADDLDQSGRDEVQRFELLEAAGQVALQAVAATGGTWYLSRMARAIVLVRVTTSNPGPQAGARAARCGSAPASARRTRARPGCARRPPRRGVRCSPRGPRSSPPAWPRTTRSASGGCSWSGTRPTPRGPRCAISWRRWRVSARSARTRPSAPWPRTWTSRGPSSGPHRSCTCTATR